MIKKNYLVLAFLMYLLLGFSSCDNDNQGEPNFISAKINNKNWKGTPEITVNTVTDSLTLLGYGNDQSIAFKVKFNGEGVYNLSGTQANYSTSVGGDVITSSYGLDASLLSQITITEYNSELEILKGHFEVSLLKRWSNPENNINSLSFTNGRFKGTMNP